MKTNFQNVRGMQDLFNEQADKYNLVVNTARQVSETYNFHEIITPIVEESNLFERSVGDGSDIVMKELYKFEDRGGNLLALRPEFTAGIARSFLNNSELNQLLPQKLFSYGPLFRYDRPQKGRYRQLNQINFEYIGNKEYIADVEIIYLFYTILQKLGLKNITLEINSLGSNECKKKYESALKEYFTKFKDKLSEDSKVRLEKNPLRILDSKEECDKLLVKDAPKISEFYTEEEKEFYSNILKTLDKLGVSYFSNPLFLSVMLSTIFNTRVVLKIILCHYIANIIIGILIRNKAPKIANNKNILKTNWKITLTKSINKSITTLLMILGTISFYMLLTFIITSLLPNNCLIKTIISGFLEITNGLNTMASLNILNKIKEIIASAIISFGGLSIHTQIKAILEDTNMNYSYFLKGRIMQSIISVILIMIF